MTKKNETKYILQGAMDVDPSEVERRTNFAKMRQIELNVLKDELNLADKAGELCRIEVALSEFDSFLVDFVRMLRQIPDKVQSVIPTTTTDQYRTLQRFIDDSLQRLSERRLHLTIESTKSEKNAASAAVAESVAKNAKIKKDSK